MVDIRKELISLKDDKYKEFQQKIIPNINNIIGVRIPIIRKISKKISKEDQINYIENYKCEYLEEYLLKGLFISNIDDIDIVISYLKVFITQIDNWSVCDTTISALKIINTDKYKFLKFIKKYIKSTEEYELRFILVVLLNYYIDDKYIDEIFNIINSINSNYYYVKMAKGWLISMLYVSYKEETTYFIDNKLNDKEVKRISIRKIIESNQISKEEKQIIKEKYV